MHKHLKKLYIIPAVCLLFFVFAVQAQETDLANRLKGHLLLQVENKGEVWYVADDLTRRQVTESNAIGVFRELSLGITNSDLDKIPTDVDSLDENKDSDGDSFSDRIEAQFGYNLFGADKASFDNNLINRLSGKLLLQVEDKGRIWYVNPLDKKKYEVKKNNVLDLFRRLALGITNNDLNKINKKIVANNNLNNPDNNQNNYQPEAPTYNPNNNTLQMASLAINSNNKTSALNYFGENLKPSIGYSLDVLDSTGRSLFADILSDASLVNSSSEQKTYTTTLPFSTGQAQVNITLEKQTDDSWVITSI